MSESFENKTSAIDKLPESERGQLREFFESTEGKQKIASMYEKVTDEVTEEEAVLAYEKLGPLLFSKEERLDDMTTKQRASDEERWAKLTGEPMPVILKISRSEEEPPHKKAA